MADLTRKQKASFTEKVLTTEVSLESAIDWINENMNPDDVFSESDLATWALNSGYIVGEEG